MAKKTLTAEVRENLKKTATRQLRKAGFIPAVIYGSTEQKAIAINAREFGREFAHISEHTIIELKVGKESHEVLIKDFQDDVLTGKITHLDFYEFERGQVLKTHVPVHVSGTAKGVKEGGLLEQLTHDVEIECLPKDLPNEIVIDISDLGEGESIKLGELPVPKDVKILGDPESTVVVITHVSVALPETGEGEGEEGLEAAEGAAAAPTEAEAEE